MYKVFDLFSGAGGMSEGFIQAGFSVPYATDISKQAAETYINRHNQLGYKITYHNGDIKELADEMKLREFLGDDFNSIDVVCGGPPCQGFSMAGRRNSKDTRNFLVQSYIKILAIVQPKYFVMENVVGLLSSKFDSYDGKKKKYKNQDVIKVLQEEFDFIGYNTDFDILDASDYGVPQSRKRIVILGSRKTLGINPKFPEKHTKKTCVEEAISDLRLSKNGDEIKTTTQYQLHSKKGRTPFLNRKHRSAKKVVNHEQSKHSKLVTERFERIPEGKSFKDVCISFSDSDKEKYKTKKKNCRRINRSTPAPTVVTLPDDYVHYQEDRIMTVREFARLQSFDDSFEFLGKRTTGGKLRVKETPQYTLVGNAVPPLLAFAIAKNIMKELG